jgi:hypothetical protein
VVIRLAGNGDASVALPLRCHLNSVVCQQLYVKFTKVVYAKLPFVVQGVKENGYYCEMETSCSRTGPSLSVSVFENTDALVVSALSYCVSLESSVRVRSCSYCTNDADAGCRCRFCTFITLL